MNYVFESGKLTKKVTLCYRCRKPVLAPQKPPTIEAYDGDMIEMRTYHPLCAVDLDAEAALDFFSGLKKPEAENAEAMAVAEKRSAAIRELAKRRSLAAKGDAFEPVTIEPARDTQGRPRVRVCFGGTLSAANNYIGMAIDRSCPDTTVASSRREYVLLRQTPGDKLREDPSQPLVAAVFGLLTDVAIVRPQKDKLAAYRAAALPTPLLWISANKGTAAADIDKKILEARAALDAAGYSGDEAMVVQTGDVTGSDDYEDDDVESDVESEEESEAARYENAAMRQVALALDELLEREARNEGSASPWENALELLIDAVESERPEAFATALQRLNRSLATRTPAEWKRVAAKTVARCVAKEPAEAFKLLLRLWPSVDTDTMASALTLALTDRTPSGLVRATEAITALRSRKDAALGPLILQALRDEKTVTKRFVVLGGALTECEDEGLIGSIEAWLATLKAADKRGPVMRELVAEMKQNALEKKKAKSKKA